MLVEFTLLFGVYFVAKVHNPEDFRLRPDGLITRAGVAITVFLLSSGYCMVKAVEVMRQDCHRAAARWVLAAILLGLGYLLIKYFELTCATVLALLVLLTQGFGEALKRFTTIY